eukprot:678467-Pleurochrysis_carterae.AAC.7
MSAINSAAKTTRRASCFRERGAPPSSESVSVGQQRGCFPLFEFNQAPVASPLCRVCCSPRTMLIRTNIRREEARAVPQPLSPSVKRAPPGTISARPHALRRLKKMLQRACTSASSRISLSDLVTTTCVAA